MIGIVIVAHGGLASHLLATMEHVVGPQKNAFAIGIEPEDDLAARQNEVDAAVEAADTGSGVIVITDMFGGTPCNLSIGAMRNPGVEILYGANLPMLVKIGKCRCRPMDEAIACALNAGRKYIDVASRMLRAKAG